MSNPKQVYQLKVTRDGVKPPIWRRLMVKEDINLLTLYEIIQRAMVYVVKESGTDGAIC